MSGQRFPAKPSTVTLQQAKDWLKAHVRDGAECPCCRQFAKVYRRKLNSLMVRSLIWLVRASGPQLRWVEVQRLAPRWLVGSGGTLPKTAYWDLAETRLKDPTDPGKGKDSGIWRPTPTGVAFVNGAIRMPSHVLLYDGRVLSLDNSADVDVHEALGNRFDYNELMRA